MTKKIRRPSELVDLPSVVSLNIGKLLKKQTYNRDSDGRRMSKIIPINAQHLSTRLSLAVPNKKSARGRRGSVQRRRKSSTSSALSHQSKLSQTSAPAEPTARKMIIIESGQISEKTSQRSKKDFLKDASKSDA